MKKFLSKHWVKIAGVATGALGGYLYYYFIGCVSGTCPITFNPYNLMLYGAVLGYLLFDLIFDAGTKHKLKQITEVSEKKDKDNSNEF